MAIDGEDSEQPTCWEVTVRVLDETHLRSITRLAAELEDALDHVVEQYRYRIESVERMLFAPDYDPDSVMAYEIDPSWRGPGAEVEV